ncbi:MAG TPA: SDR family oxidoreductase [Paracoccaceae bacterium]|nr:SDR family oxidoreductase [Paracoccaceae bacterium]
METGIRGRKAIVCAASRGLGRGCAEALAAEGVALTIAARTKACVDKTAGEIAERHGVTVTPVACDVTTEEGRAALLAACPDPDILVNNAGGPPPGDFRDFHLDDWRRAVEGNMISPIALIHATVYGMCDRGFGRIVNITSYSVKHPIPTLELSNGARAGLTGAIASLARKVARHNVAINNMLPGPFGTDRLLDTSRAIAERTGQNFDEVHAGRAAENPTRRFGTTEEFGAMCAFLCSAHAGYIIGQNIILDGGRHQAML